MRQAGACRVRFLAPETPSGNPLSMPKTRQEAGTPEACLQVRPCQAAVSCDVKPGPDLLDGVGSREVLGAHSDPGRLSHEF